MLSYCYVRVVQAALVLHRLSIDLLPLSSFMFARQAPKEFTMTWNTRYELGAGHTFYSPRM